MRKFVWCCALAVMACGGAQHGGGELPAGAPAGADPLLARVPASTPYVAATLVRSPPEMYDRMSKQAAALKGMDVAGVPAGPRYLFELFREMAVDGAAGLERL